MSSTPHLHTLSLHDALPILRGPSPSSFNAFFRSSRTSNQSALFVSICSAIGAASDHASIELGERLCEAFEIFRERSEEHTSELQSQFHLVCRLLLEKKKTQ